MLQMEIMEILSLQKCFLNLELSHAKVYTSLAKITYEANAQLCIFFQQIQECFSLVKVLYISKVQNFPRKTTVCAFNLSLKLMNLET